MPVWHFTDLNKARVATLSHGTLSVSPRGVMADAIAIATGTRTALEPVILEQKMLTGARPDGSVKIAGDSQQLRAFRALLANFKSGIPLALPALNGCGPQP
jgi:alkyl sulfatase BDS1-like metallo-beta-lactamase superfamily hydrolase